jgi:hypothetical protein
MTTIFIFLSICLVFWFDSHCGAIAPLLREMSCYFFLQPPESRISKTSKFPSKRLRRVQIPRERRGMVVSENRTDAHDFGRCGDAYAPRKASALLTFLKRSMRTALSSALAGLSQNPKPAGFTPANMRSTRHLCCSGRVLTAEGVSRRGDTAATTLGAQRTSQARLFSCAVASTRSGVDKPSV